MENVLSQKCYVSFKYQRTEYNEMFLNNARIQYLNNANTIINTFN